MCIPLQAPYKASSLCFMFDSASVKMLQFLHCCLCLFFLLFCANLSTVFSYAVEFITGSVLAAALSAQA